MPPDLEGYERKTNDAFNPDYLTAFRRKLLRATIDINERVAWHAMRWPTGLTSTHPAPIGATDQAFSWSQVERRNVSIVDAIACAHELRNKVSTHRMKYESRFITALEVLSC